MIGMGQININLAKILRGGFNANVSYFNRTRNTTLENELGIKYKSLDDILSDSDVIVISLGLNTETQHFLNVENLRKVKSSAIIINPAHPDLIEPIALYNALTTGRLAGCAMDWYYTSADQDIYGLLKLPDDKFICTSHIASRTCDAWDNTDIMAMQNIADFFETGNCPHIVNPGYWKNTQILPKRGNKYSIIIAE